jgi:hypothetical protein
MHSFLSATSAMLGRDAPARPAPSKAPAAAAIPAPATPAPRAPASIHETPSGPHYDAANARRALNPPSPTPVRAPRPAVQSPSAGPQMRAPISYAPSAATVSRLLFDQDSSLQVLEASADGHRLQLGGGARECLPRVNECRAFLVAIA